MYTVINDHCLDILQLVEDESVHCVVTSPPYWGLRDYGLEPVVWGGESGCGHEWGDQIVRGGPAGAQGTTSQRNGRSNVEWQKRQGDRLGCFCLHCSAWRGSLGLEPTPELYVEHMTAVFREVRRVLRGDGTVWLNLGDSYTAGGGTQIVQTKNASHGLAGYRHKTPGFKPKDLCMIPARVALALQAPYEHHAIQRDIDRAWLAALVDGEGCIGIRRYDSHSNGLESPRCQDGFVPYISIGNNDRELLDRCVAITRLGSVRIKDRPKTDGRGIVSRRTYYGWRLDGNAAVSVICDIFPFLLAKRRQAVIAYTLDCSNKGGRSLRGNGPLPAEEQQKRELLKSLINKANQRESFDMPSWCEAPKTQFEPGWYLRSEIIWAKPNPMPESVRDRPTRSHEVIYLLSKSDRYYYDWEAVAEPLARPNEAKRKTPGKFGGADKHAEAGKQSRLHSGNEYKGTPTGTRNRRDVWTISTKPYKEAHFATFPPDLVEPCILAGCPPGGMVLDPFGGSGTVGQVAEALSRDSILIEANPAYVDLAEKRINAPLTKSKCKARKKSDA